MPSVFSKRLSKGSKHVIIAGLTILVIILIVTTRAFTKNKANLINRLIVYLSRYRRLWPYIVAQAKVETAYDNNFKVPFTSPVYRKNNNLFGMKGATKRAQLGSPGTPASDGGAYQKYWTDSQSIRDLFLYFDYVNFPTSVSSPEQYVRELKSRNYFTAPEDQYLLNFKRWL